jgi:hypothetical protein
MLPKIMYQASYRLCSIIQHGRSLSYVSVQASAPQWRPECPPEGEDPFDGRNLLVKTGSVQAGPIRLEERGDDRADRCDQKLQYHHEDVVCALFHRFSTRKMIHDAIADQDDPRLQPLIPVHHAITKAWAGSVTSPPSSPLCLIVVLVKQQGMFVRA